MLKILNSGETVGNAAKIIYKAADEVLTDKGQRQVLSPITKSFFFTNCLVLNVLKKQI